MLKSLRKDSPAFTIIEVLIVLSIVGLIMLIVFLAVPALQRNQRNTSRKHDIASLLAAVSEYTGNHDGKFPLGAGSNGIPFNDPSAYIETSPKLGYYDLANVLWFYNATVPAITANQEAVDNIAIGNYGKCNSPSDGNWTTTGASKASVVAIYSIETANGSPSYQCKDL